MCVFIIIVVIIIIIISIFVKRCKVVTLEALAAVFLIVVPSFATSLLKEQNRFTSNYWMLQISCTEVFYMINFEPLAIELKYILTLSSWLYLLEHPVLFNVYLVILSDVLL